MGIAGIRLEFHYCPSHRVWLENPTLLELPSAYKFPSGRSKSKISDAADVLGVCIIYQIVGHLALSWWSQKELTALPYYPHNMKREGVTWRWPRGLLANGGKQQHNGTLATKGFGMAKTAKIVVA